MDLFDEAPDTPVPSPFSECKANPQDIYFLYEQLKKKHSKAAVHKHINESINDNERRKQKILERIRQKKVKL